MERIASLIRRLAELNEQGQTAASMLEVVNELQSLLQQSVISHVKPVSSTRIALILPEFPSSAAVIPESTQTGETIVPSVKEEEKIIQELVVDEAEVEAELEQIRQNAAFTEKIQATQARLKPGILTFNFEGEEDVAPIPTLAQHSTRKPTAQKETVQPESETISGEDQSSLNDQLKENTQDIVHFLGEVPIKDLRKAIGINDRYLYINELFRGDEDMYERSIKTINNFSAYGEAQYWMERELKVKLGWDLSKQIAKDFYSLVKRRFA